MDTELQRRFSDQQLRRILEESFVFQCACPAQVAEQVLKMRGLYAYQQSCIDQGPVSAKVHRMIAASTTRAHADLEGCLEDILTLEGWDMETLTMPEALRASRDKDLEP